MLAHSLRSVVILYNLPLLTVLGRRLYRRKTGQPYYEVTPDLNRSSRTAVEAIC